MALKRPPVWVCSQKPHSHLATLDLRSSRGRIMLDLRPSKWECCSLGASAQRAINPVEDEKPNTPRVRTSRTGKIGQAQYTVSRTFHRDLNLLSSISYFLRAILVTTRIEPLTQPELSPLPDGSKVRVAYQGIPGAYSEDAALKAYPNCETVPCDQYEETFNVRRISTLLAVELLLVDKAVLPIENSVGGSIHSNYDLLLQRSLYIVREVLLVVNHSLLALPGVRKQEVKRVFSHPQALDQCEMTLTKLGVIRVNADDSAGAARMVASSGIRDIGAIASSRAAALYGLDILQEKIQDEDINVTRFLVLAKEPIIPGTYGLFKTSIVFSLEEGPGMLFKALTVFSLRGINLSKIESRPQRRCPLRVVDNSNNGTITYFDYLFYIDFEASMAETRAQNALRHLQEYAGFLRILGSYPMDKTL